MLVEERKQRILESIRRDGRVVAAELSSAFAVSEDTIRRDLRELAAEGRLRRVHGGALPVSREASLPIAERRRESVEEKRALALAAARLVSPGQLLVLDGGSTNLLLAEALPAELTGTVVTSSPAIALALGGHRALEVVLLGGRLLSRTGTVVGPEAVDALRNLRADLCVLGVCSLHPEHGVTATELEEAPVKRAMVACAAEVMALATADKLETAAPYRVAAASELGRLVTSQAAPEARTSPYAALGVEVVRVALRGPE